MTVEKKRAELRIAGKVQGVFFRASTREQARARDLGGWVKNLPDGTVEAVVEGPVDDVEELVEWAHQGPSSARVEHVDVQWTPPRGEPQTFEVRR
jgi:acylphosphatase